jgi:uncharacterized protein (DUF433 family)
MSGDLETTLQAIADWLAERPENDVTFSLQTPITAMGTDHHEVRVTDRGPDRTGRIGPILGERLARVAASFGIDVPPPRAAVTIDPRKNFGRPSIRGITCEAIAGMVAAGEDPADVAEDYEITLHEVLLACWHEGQYGPPRRRRAWKKWADSVGPALGGWVPLDLETVAWPPTRVVSAEHS